MRGEHQAKFVNEYLIDGSSPHARGTHRNPMWVMIRNRFIPACAGNTSFGYKRMSEVTVHPRMRGEHTY